jgi:hypothetical protein
MLRGDRPRRLRLVIVWGKFDAAMTPKEPLLLSYDATKQAPFIVTEPCGVCQGEGTRGTGEGQDCPACQSTGVGRFFHGTKAALAQGDLIAPGYRANFGNLARTTTYVYFTGTLDAAIWGAELAIGESPGRIYAVEPTGPIEDDPNLTNQRFPGNPTKSFRSQSALRVTGEVSTWQGHPPEQLQAMKDGLERLKAQGVEPLDD